MLEHDEAGDTRRQRWLFGLAILLAPIAFGGDWRFAVMGAAAAYFFVAFGNLLDHLEG